LIQNCDFSKKSTKMSQKAKEKIKFLRFFFMPFYEQML